MNTLQNTADLLARHGHAEAKFVVRAPGRVNLIGEHTDYNDGFVLPCAINFATEIAIAPRHDLEIRVFAADYDLEEDRFPADRRPEHGDKHWSHYIRGVVDVFIQRYGALPHGFDMVISGNIPQGAGLSSSASLEVAVGKALQTLYDFDTPPRDIALLGQQAENEFVGCRCGIMDQFISAMGKAGHALLIDCRNLNTKPVPIPDGLAIMIIDSKVKRGLVDSEYNTRRAQCEAAAAHFGVKALREVSLEQLEAARDALDPVVYRRARHVITENERTLAATTALANHDIAWLSRLMAASHASMRDDFAITVPAIDALVAMIADVLGERGGVRMTGGGFGGCVVALVPDALVADVQAVVERDYPAQTGLHAQIHLCRSEDGVHVRQTH